MNNMRRVGAIASVVAVLCVCFCSSCKPPKKQKEIVIQQNEKKPEEKRKEVAEPESTEPRDKNGKTKNEKSDVMSRHFEILDDDSPQGKERDVNLPYHRNGDEIVVSGADSTGRDQLEDYSIDRIQSKLNDAQASYSQKQYAQSFEEAREIVSLIRRLELQRFGSDGKGKDVAQYQALLKNANQLVEQSGNLFQNYKYENEMKVFVY